MLKIVDFHKTNFINSNFKLSIIFLLELTDIINANFFKLGQEYVRQVWH